MKIILTVTSPSIDSAVDLRFGRGTNLLIVDTESLQWQAIPNPGLTTSGGAGIQAAQFAADQEAVAVLSGDFGPHAFAALQAAGIAMYIYGDCKAARQAIERFQIGQLKQVKSPTRAECENDHHG
jgi:predicted Fe-Mo cluster-binding NifX family protein